MNIIQKIRIANTIEKQYYKYKCSIDEKNDALNKIKKSKIELLLLHSYDPETMNDYPRMYLYEFIEKNQTEICEK